MIMLKTAQPVDTAPIAVSQKLGLHETHKAEAPGPSNSRSYQAGHSDISDTTSGDTVPSSFTEEVRPTPHQSVAKLTGKRYEGSSRNTSSSHPPQTHTGFSFDDARSNGASQNPSFKLAEAEPGSTEGGLRSDMSRSDLRRAPLRRHTSPPTKLNIPGSRMKFLEEPAEGYSILDSSDVVPYPSMSIPALAKRANSTADIPKLRSDATKDTFNDEISRMRNSIIVKRNFKKQQRMESHDAEDILVGNRISEGHENFVMAYNMLTGLRVAVSRCSGMMKKISNDDFKSTKKLTFNMDGNELTPSSKYDFKFKDYCPEVFRELRALFGIDPADYLISITGKYILSELGSPGKSGSFFYYSRDFRFIIKTIHHSEHKQLRRILKDYYNHVKNNPNTLISQFYGLHRLKVRGGMKKVHFIVMNNLFPPHRDIHQKYDLKGSTWGRYTKIVPGNGNEECAKVSYSSTLKDLNWVENREQIHFGPKKRKLFFQQLDADVTFLKRINAMDYSLLLGIHDVQKGNSDTLLNLSVFDPKSNSKNDLIKTNPRDIDREVDLPVGNFPGRTRYIFYGHDGGIRGTNESDEPLRVIYYLGIIDCLTNYSLKKRLETIIRSIGHGRKSISAVPSIEYGDRFYSFISQSVSGVSVSKDT